MGSLTVNGTISANNVYGTHYGSGANLTGLAVYFDIARTIARRAERRVVKIAEPPFIESLIGRRRKVLIGSETLAYLNRLSSLLYASARLANHKAGIVEDSPDYK